MAQFPSRTICFVLFSSLLLLAGCAQSEENPTQLLSESTTPARLKTQIVRTYPFDPGSFVEGLELSNDKLLVSTGLEGNSRIYWRTLVGEELISASLPADLFGEGATHLRDSLGQDIIWQITWDEEIAIKRDAHSLKELDRAHYNGEGWGLCNFGDRIIMSNGSDTLTVRDPRTFEELTTIPVTVGGRPLPQLNELACVSTPGKEEIYANIWQSEQLVRIDAASGAVTAIIDASSLPNTAEPSIDNVLNGIAHNTETATFFLTGKRWPTMYEVSFVP